MARSGISRSFSVEVEQGVIITLELVASRGNLIGPKGGDVESLFHPCVECGKLCNPWEFLVQRTMCPNGLCYLEGIETGPDARKCYRHFPEFTIPLYLMPNKRLKLRIRKLRNADGSLVAIWSLPTKGRTKWRKVAQHKAGIFLEKYYSGPKKGQYKLMRMQPRVDRSHARDGSPYSQGTQKNEELSEFLDDVLSGL